MGYGYGGDPSLSNKKTWNPCICAYDIPSSDDDDGLANPTSIPSNGLPRQNTRLQPVDSMSQASSINDDIGFQMISISPGSSEKLGIVKERELSPSPQSHTHLEKERTPETFINSKEPRKDLIVLDRTKTKGKTPQKKTVENDKNSIKENVDRSKKSTEGGALDNISVLDDEVVLESSRTKNDLETSGKGKIVQRNLNLQVDSFDRGSRDLDSTTAGGKGTNGGSTKGGDVLERSRKEERLRKVSSIEGQPRY